MAEVEGWKEVHKKGDARKPWNVGQPFWGVTPQQMRKTERRFKARRKRDIDEARRLGVDGPGFERIAAQYLRGYGNV